MLLALLALCTFLATLTGGIIALKNTDRLHRILGFTAGVMIGVVAFSLLPEIFELVTEINVDPVVPMLALVGGFLLFHIIEKLLIIHHVHEAEYSDHHHPQVGVLSALAISGHSFLDGIGIGLALQVDVRVGIAVAIAVIAHAFADGLNTVSLMLTNKNTSRKSILLLVINAMAPLLGAASTLLFVLPPQALLVYLGFFAGFLLYIGSSDILPEAHSKHPSKITLSLTVLGVIFIFAVTQLA